MLKTCPYCNAQVTPLEFAKAGVWKDKALHCPACHKTISEFWLYPPLLPFLLAAIVQWRIIEASHFGWSIDIPLILVTSLGSLVLFAYLMTPLQRIDEARSVLHREMKRFRSRRYDELVASIGTQETKELSPDEGAAYHMEFEAFWDDKPGGAVRFIGSVSDGGWWDFHPLSDDFLMNPDGSLVDD